MFHRGLVALTVAAVAAVACSSALASSVTQLPFQYGGWMAVDGTHSHVFVSGGTGTSAIQVLDFDGTIVGTVTGQQGASGLVVDESTDTLYAALHDATAISVIDTATLTESSRMSVAPLSLPMNLALAGGKLWFTHSCQSGGGTGSIDLDGTDVTDETDLPNYCPTFATTPGDTDLLAVGDMGISPTTLEVWDVSTAPPTLVKSVWNPGGSSNLRALAFSPDAGNVLMATGSPYYIQKFVTSDLSLAGTYPTGPYPTAITMSADGDYVAAGADAYYDKDIFIYPVGDTTAIRSWDFNSTSKNLQPGGLAFSPDASRLFATSTNDATSKLDFRVYTNPTVPLLASATSLSLSKSKITFGNRVTLKAHVSGPTSGKVQFYATPYGGSKTPLKSVAIGSSGNASLTLKPAGKTTYKAEFVESDIYAHSASANKTVTVRSKTTLATSGGYGTSGKYRLYHLSQKAYMTGKVIPNHAGSGLKFVVERYASGWRGAASGAFPIQSSGATPVIRGQQTPPARSPGLQATTDLVPTFSVMELAGLEPATSWVRFHLDRSSGFATGRHFRTGAASGRRDLSSFSWVRDRYLTKT
jgi:hypothetical protein